MEAYQAALEGTEPSAPVGASRTVAGSVSALVAAYLDCSPSSTSPFKSCASERSARAGILENFRKAYGDLPLYRAVGGSACCCSHGNICSVS